MAAVLDVEVLALVGHLLTAQERPINVEKLLRDLIALGVGHVEAVAAVFNGVSAGHHVDEHSSHPKDDRASPSCDRIRPVHRGPANRHEIAQFFGERHEC